MPTRLTFLHPSTLLQERTLAAYNKDVVGVLEAVTLRLSRVENSVDGLSSQVRSLSATLQQVAEDTGSAAANTQHLRDKQLLIEEQQRLAEVQLSEAKSQVEKLKDVADQAAKATLREFQAQQQQQQQQAEEDRAPSPATTAPAPPAPAHPFVPAQAPTLAMAPPYAPPGGPPPPPFGAYGMPPGAPPGYPPVPYPDFHPPQGMVSPPPPPMMDGPPMYGGYGVPPVGSGYAMPQYSPPPPPAPPRGPPPPPPQLSSQSVSVDKVVADVAAMVRWTSPARGAFSRVLTTSSRRRAPLSRDFLSRRCEMPSQRSPPAALVQWTSTRSLTTS